MNAPHVVMRWSVTGLKDEEGVGLGDGVRKGVNEADCDAEADAENDADCDLDRVSRQRQSPL